MARPVPCVKRPLYLTFESILIRSTTGVTSFSAAAKVKALNSFIDKVSNGKGFCIAGASLGGAAAIEVAAANEKCEGLVLLDAVSAQLY